MLFRFSDYILDTSRRELRCGDQSIEVEPQVLDLLIYLMENHDRVVSKDDLIASVWGGRIVSDTTLTSRIYAARRAIGDSGRNQKFDPHHRAQGPAFHRRRQHGGGRCGDACNQFAGDGSCPAIASRAAAA